MDPALQATHEKLLKVRERTDLNPRRSPLLADTFTALDGTEKEFKLRYYQVQMVIHLMALKRFLIGDDTGLGKTIEVIAALCYLWEKDPGRKVIVIGNKSAVGQWADAFRMFTKVVDPIVAAGKPAVRKAAYKEWLRKEEYPVLIMGYGSVRQDFRLMQGWEDYILITDEAQAFKNPTSQTHQIMRHLAGPDRANRVWGLTATLIKNNLVEGFGIFKVVVPGLFSHTRNSFMNDYCIVQMQPIGNGRRVPVIRGYRQADILRFKARIDPYHLGRAKFDVAKDLPTLQIKEVKHGLTPFQQRKYAEALEGLLEVGDGEQKEVSKLTAVTYCQEIVDHPCLIGFEDEGSEKLDTLLDLLGPGGELEGEKVILFTRFRKLVDFAKPWLEKKLKVKSVRVTGAESKAGQREAAMAAFQKHDSDKNIIWITMAGSDSINLQAAKAIVFIDTPWSAGDYLQILGRMIRIGSLHDMVYAIHLIATGSIDAKTLSVVRKKLKLVEAILGKRIKGEDTGETADFIEEVRELNEVYNGLVADARGASL